MKFFLTVSLLVCIDLAQTFFVNPPFDLSTVKPRRNLTCANDFSQSEAYTDCEYCVYEYFSNGTDSTIEYDCIYITNSYRLVTKRCSGFTDGSDVGYGLCAQLPFESFDINLLCICASELCNENFTTCKQSVDSEPNLPSLPSPVPDLTSNAQYIQCNDTPLGLLNSTYYCFRDSTPYINLTGCEEYVRTHTVLCRYLESEGGDYLTVAALPDEDYEYVLAEQIETMQRMSEKASVVQLYNETAGAFYIYWNETLVNVDNSTVIFHRCYCLGDNCNTNLTACLQSTGRSNRAERLFSACSLRLSVLTVLVFFLRNLLA